MTIYVISLGSQRMPREQLRIGAVRIPWAKGDSVDSWYDIWLPILASHDVDTAEADDWSIFEARFRAQMREPAAARVIELLALLSREATFSVGCYCVNEALCHRRILRQLLRDKGAFLEE